MPYRPVRMVSGKYLTRSVLSCYPPSCLLALSFEVFTLFTPFTLSLEGSFEGRLEVPIKTLAFLSLSPPPPLSARSDPAIFQRH